MIEQSILFDFFPSSSLLFNIMLIDLSIAYIRLVKDPVFRSTISNTFGIDLFCYSFFMFNLECIDHHHHHCRLGDDVLT